MNILIGGSSPSETNNRGDAAVFNTFCEGMRQEFPGCRITSLVMHPNADWDRLFDVKSIRNFDHATREQSLGRIFNKLSYIFGQLLLNSTLLHSTQKRSVTCKSFPVS